MSFGKTCNFSKCILQVNPSKNEISIHFLTDFQCRVTLDHAQQISSSSRFHWAKAPDSQLFALGSSDTSNAMDTSYGQPQTRKRQLYSAFVVSNGELDAALYDE